MGFLSGRVSFVRYRIAGSPPGTFSDKHLRRLAGLAAGTQKFATSDGVEIGWTAGDHVLDTSFELAKNIVNNALIFCLRVDSEKVPADLLRAYYQIELKALSKDNPSGLPSGRQKREAREAAKERIEKEAKDGRYVHRKAVELLWDGVSNELLISTTAVTVLDRLFTIFKQTFDLSFEPLSAGRFAFDFAGPREQTRGVDDARPSEFVLGNTPGELAWLPDEASRDFLGNEFLLWLWYLTDSETDTIALSDGSQSAVMLARSLTLECPRGQTGKESITSDGPARLPEARRAVQTGKLPRQCGLTIVRHDAQYELTLQAETLAVSGCKLPPPEEENERARLEERVMRTRHLIETLDLLYDQFCERRSGTNWVKELVKIQRWLRHEGKAKSG